MGILFAILFIVGLVLAVTLPIVTFVQTEKVKLGKSLPGVGLALFFLSLALSFTTIDAGSVGIVKRFGQATRQLQPGAHFVLPYADTVTPVAVQTRIVKPSEEASSRDLQMVNFEVTFAYHVDSAHATEILTQLNDDAESRVITPAILEAIKSVTAQYDVQELVGKRPEVRDKIESFVKTRLLPYHIVAETVSITNFKFSEQYEQSIEAKVTAQQNAEKALNDLQRIKTEAQQKIEQAKGEAEALKSQKEQITPELLQLRTIEMMSKNWDGHLPTTIVGGNGALPMLDVLEAARKK
jgi:prohibitin 2